MIQNFYLNYSMMNDSYCDVKNDEVNVNENDSINGCYLIDELVDVSNDEHYGAHPHYYLGLMMNVF